MATYWLKIANFSTPSHLGLSLGVTPFKFMEKLYGSWNKGLFCSRQWRFGDASLHRFWLIHPCDWWSHRRTDGQTELLWLWRAKAISPFAHKKITFSMALNQQYKLTVMRITFTIDVLLFCLYLFSWRQSNNSRQGIKSGKTAM